MFYKHIWYIYCSSPHVYVNGLNVFIGEYFRSHLDGYPLSDLSDLVSGRDAYVSGVLDRFRKDLSVEVFVLFNYNHFGPVALVFPPSGDPKLLIGYAVWNFTHYHYRYFLGRGIYQIHPRLNTPRMFYPAKRGSFEVVEVVSTCMLKFAIQFDITRSLSRRVMKLVKQFERGYTYTLFGRRLFDMGELFSEILFLVRNRFGKAGYEHLLEIFLDHRVYCEPVVGCEEFRRPLELIRQFLYTIDDKPESPDLEKYLIGLGFFRIPEYSK